MPLPELIEIVPLEKHVQAQITVPGSKSITNRALILAALADGTTTLKGALWSEDTQVMTEALQKLGFDVKVENDPDEFCNRTIMVKGLGGRIPKAGTAEKPLELFVGNAGTAARFLAAMVCLGDGVYRLSGVPRMHERPQAALFKALRELGYEVESENGNDKLPARISKSESAFKRSLLTETIRLNPSDPMSFMTVGNPLGGSRSCTVSIAESSQFASALLLSASVGKWRVNIVGENAEESPYVAMTSKLVEAFPKSGGIFQIEPDASSGSYFWAVGWLFPLQPAADKPGGISRYDLRLFLKGGIVEKKFFSVRVLHWPDSNMQIDQDFPALLPEPPHFKGTISRSTDLGDSIMTAIVLAPFASDKCTFTDISRLRVQECERVKALEAQLVKCNAKAKDHGPVLLTEDGAVLLIDDEHALELDGPCIDTLEVYPSQLHGAEIETYNDHRMAMCFAILGLKVPGIKIKNPACVKKTFPNFFQKLATPPPHGLGATIRDGKTGEKLELKDLFAD